MTASKLEIWFERMPVVAILRGVRPDEVVDMAKPCITPE